MFKAGQIVKTRGGDAVKILAVLDRPTSDGYSVVGLLDVGGDESIEKWQSNCRFIPGEKSNLDLLPPPLIVTSHVFPPIPLRNFDWCAFYDGDEETGNRGWGATEAEAIADLKDNFPHEEAEAA